VECGFLSNYAAEQKLATNSYQDKIAESITKSVSKYLNED
jgi:N-acetylmuramoyl-L-alanine amidase